MRNDTAGASKAPTSDLHETADLACVDAVEGWLSLAEARSLRTLARGVAAEQAIVEVGSYRGRSTVALALGARRGRGANVYAIDPHQPFIGARGGRFGPDDRAAFYANVTRAGVGDAVVLVGLASLAAARAWSRADVGLLFLDGDHRYESVAADFAAWSPHLAPRAIVAFDDCDFADVARIVGELERAGVLRAAGATGKMRWFERC